MKEKMVEIFCRNNGAKKMYPAGTSLLEIYSDMKLQLKYGVTAAKANNKVKDLKFCVYKPKTIEFIGPEVPAGMRAYTRSLCFVLYKAVKETIPGASLRIEHPISRGYYCQVNKADKSPLQESEVNAIKEAMKNCIKQDIPFEMETKSAEEAIAIFKEQNATDKITLISSLHSLYTDVYKLGDLYDYYYGCLVPSTGYLNIFDVKPYNEGMLLQIPDRDTPNKLERFIVQDKMFHTISEQAEWNAMMKVHNVGDINLAVADKKSRAINSLIKVGEALQDKKIAKIADMIKEKKTARIVLIAGPSSSGKTTFSKKLGIQLAVNALRPVTISLDDYFVNRVDTPRDEKGEYDFESIYALDLALFNKQMNQLLAGEEIELPYYNFETGQREFRGNRISIKPDDILVIEGIHGLNPELTKMIPEEQKFKIYISALTTLSLDDHNWIPTTDNRLLRRIVRDYNYRGYSAKETIHRWANVREGEEKWIFPYQENADAMFNSALLFEIPVIKKYAEPILLEVPCDCDEYAEAFRLLKFLRYFINVPDNEVPMTSVLREFVGGSSFEY